MIINSLLDHIMFYTAFLLHVAMACMRMYADVLSVSVLRLWQIWFQILRPCHTANIRLIISKQCFLIYDDSFSKQSLTLMQCGGLMQAKEVFEEDVRRKLIHIWRK